MRAPTRAYSTVDSNGLTLTYEVEQTELMDTSRKTLIFVRRAKGILRKAANKVSCLECGCVRRPHHLDSVTMSLAVGTRMGGPSPWVIGPKYRLGPPFFLFIIKFSRQTRGQAQRAIHPTAK